MSGNSLGTLVTFNPWTVGPTALVEEIATRFTELGVHHVPVVDADRHVIGIVSETDLLRAANRGGPCSWAMACPIPTKPRSSSPAT